MVENIIDIDDYRLIVNKLSYYHDVSNIEKRRKKIYSDIVEKYDYQTKLIGIYKYLMLFANKIKTFLPYRLMYNVFAYIMMKNMNNI